MNKNSPVVIGLAGGAIISILVIGAVRYSGDEQRPTMMIEAGAGSYDTPAGAQPTEIGGETVQPEEEFVSIVRLPQGMAQAGNIELTGEAIGAFKILDDRIYLDSDGRQVVQIYARNVLSAPRKFEGKIYFRLAQGDQLAPVVDAGS